jgi:hypothetical protein
MKVTKNYMCISCEEESMTSPSLACTKCDPTHELRAQRIKSDLCVVVDDPLHLYQD